MTAYAYLRKSSVRDPARDVSHEVQEAAVRAMAALHGDGDGLVILSDWDKSGMLGADKRPGYRKLLDAIESGQASAVYSYSLSRLARSIQELSRLIADCEAKGIPVRLDVDRFDTSTASGKLLAHVLGSVAQFESDIASERVRGANAAKLAHGDSLRSVRNYGEVRTTKDGAIRGEGDDAPAVLAAFREAGSFSGAAKLLNEREVRPRGSKRGWWPSSVSVVVKRLDPTVGHRGGGRGVGAAGSDFILARLLRCPTCGTRLTGTRDRGGRRVRYSCRLGTSKPHERISITEHLILPVIQAEVGRLRTPTSVQSEADAELRSSLEARRERILDMREAGSIDRADSLRRLAAVAEAEAKIDARDVVMAVPEIDWSWQPAKINGVLRALFDRIDLNPGTFQPKPEGYAWTVPEWRAM